MRKSIFMRLCLCLSVALFELPLMAQGVVVYKTDGTQVKFAYEEIDSIVTYNVDADVDDPVISPTDSRAIDLGLSVKWASCNVGAESPEEYGDYFAWGETKTKSDYTSDNSDTYGLATLDLESQGIIGSDGNLTTKYDAAAVNWGGNWRMPTKEELDELINNCTWSWTTQNNINGYKVTGPNGNSIFLPAAGYLRGTSLISGTSIGFYWSAKPYSDSSYARYLYFDSGYRETSGGTRSDGFTVRPVTK